MDAEETTFPQAHDAIIDDTQGKDGLSAEARVIDVGASSQEQVTVHLARDLPVLQDEQEHQDSGPRAGRPLPLDLSSVPRELQFDLTAFDSPRPLQDRVQTPGAVSYTHLTLPTICSV